jgi:hypothetical protein
LQPPRETADLKTYVGERSRIRSDQFHSAPARPES